MADNPDGPLRIGVSSCLLGNTVRFDGGHKRDAFLLGSFARFVEFVPVCPELELGLGVPRDTIRLERRGGETRFVMPKPARDLTEAMRRFSERRVAELEREHLSGFVLKKDSPSCGMERVKVYGPGGAPRKDGRGLFAEALIARFPQLPVEEEGRLGDAKLRENFVQRVFAYRRLTRFFEGRWTLGGLVALHTAHKLLLMAHSPAAYQKLGRLVAGAKSRERLELRAEYPAAVMSALLTPATTRRHTNVLHHVMGYLSRGLDASERAELVSLIDDYRRGLVPLLAPLVLLRHHVKRQGVGYLSGQIYLEPHPKELMLLNHV